MRSSLPPLLVLSLLPLAACSEKAGHNGGDGEDKTFLRADTVQVTSPANGETVESPFILTFDAGKNVDHVQLSADGAQVATADVGDGEITVTLTDGLHDLELAGFAADGAPLSAHDLSIRVAAAGDPWVTIQSPADGSNVYNPVAFVVDGSDDLADIQIYVDGDPLGSVDENGLLTVQVPGEGEAHLVEARGYDSDGKHRVSQGITLTLEEGTAPQSSDYNAVVLDILAGYPTDGTHDYYWPDDGDGWYGTTRDVRYRGQLVAEGDPEGRCYCVGLTWEVMMRAFDEVDASTGGDGTLNGLSVGELSEFRVDWFVRELYGDGVVTALENYGVGEQVTSWDDVQAGDFVQFWRNSGSGHSVIFVDWETDSGGDIDGFRYWSTQSGTDGIGYNSEYFGTSGSSVDASTFFVARAAMPQDWVSY